MIRLRASEKDKRNMRRPAMRIFHKLMIMSIIIGIIPTFLLSSFLVIENNRNYDKELYASYWLNLKSYATNVEYWIKHDYMGIVQQLALNSTVQAGLTQAFSEGDPYKNAQAVSKEINKYLMLEISKGMDKCMIYSSMNDLPIYGYNVTMLDSAKNENWYQQYMAQQKDYVYYYKRDMPFPTLALIKPIISTDFYSGFYSQNLGIVKLDILLNSLLARLLTSAEKTENIYSIAAYNQQNQLLYTSSTEWSDQITKQVQQEILQAGQQGLYIKAQAGTAYVASSELSVLGIRIFMIFPQDSVRSKVFSIIKSTLLLMSLSLLLVFLFSRLSFGRFAKRIQNLLSKMEKVKAGDFSVSGESQRGADELTVIDSNFNEMVIRLRETIHTNYTAELQKLDAELRALQLQINPHFLYNTLETVSAIAVTHQLFIVGDILEKLGEMFRYAVKKNSRDLVPLREEIHHAENYVFIQKVRFPDKFDVFYHVPQELEDCMVPFFILQPVVENAILHGMKGGTFRGSIEISACQKDSMLIFSVEDDGIGMDAGQLKNLMLSIRDQKNNPQQSIGLRNVQMRLQLAYGPPYGLTIDSAPGKGTRVQIHVPLPEIAEGRP